jgi:transposase, IS6 family
MRRRCRRVLASRSSFAGFRFPPDVITLAVRWHLRYGLSYRDVVELLAEWGITVDHVTTIYRWVQRFTPLRIDAARPCRHTLATGDSWMKHTSKFWARVTLGGNRVTPCRVPGPA